MIPNISYVVVVNLNVLHPLIKCGMSDNKDSDLIIITQVIREGEMILTISSPIAQHSNFVLE